MRKKESELIYSDNRKRNISSKSQPHLNCLGILSSFVFYQYYQLYFYTLKLFLSQSGR